MGFTYVHVSWVIVPLLLSSVGRSIHPWTVRRLIVSEGSQIHGSFISVEDSFCHKQIRSPVKKKDIDYYLFFWVLKDRDNNYPLTITNEILEHQVPTPLCPLHSPVQTLPSPFSDSCRGRTFSLDHSEVTSNLQSNSDHLYGLRLINQTYIMTSIII